MVQTRIFGQIELWADRHQEVPFLTKSQWQEICQKQRTDRVISSDISIMWLFCKIRRCKVTSREDLEKKEAHENSWSEKKVREDRLHERACLVTQFEY